MIINSTWAQPCLDNADIKYRLCTRFFLLHCLDLLRYGHALPARHEEDQGQGTQAIQGWFREPLATRHTRVCTLYCTV